MIKLGPNLINETEHLSIEFYYNHLFEILQSFALLTDDQRCIPLGVKPSFRALF